MNALDKAFLKAYGQQSETKPKLMPLSAALELSRDNAPSSENEQDITINAEIITEEIAAEEISTEEFGAEQNIVEESHFEHQTNLNSEPPPTATPEFQPLLQVDAFAWPKACNRLETTALDQLAAAADQIDNQSQNGQKIIGFISEQSGSGCTTLLLSVARHLAERCRVAIVDANYINPGLSRDLGLLPDVGLKDVNSGTVPLDEALIESLDDHLTLLPYAGHAEPHYGVDPHASSTDLRQIAVHYDIVLVDLGTSDLSYGNNIFLKQIDTAVIIRDARARQTNGLSRSKNILQAAAVDIIGIVENRTDGRPAILEDETIDHDSGTTELGIFSDAA